MAGKGHSGGFVPIEKCVGTRLRNLRFDLQIQKESGEVRTIEDLKGKRVLSLDEVKRVIERLEAGK